MRLSVNVSYISPFFPLNILKRAHQKNLEFQMHVIFFVKIKKEAIMAATSLSSLVFFGNEKLHSTQRLSQRAIE